MITSKIASGHGDAHKLKVNKEGTIGVVVHNHPPINDAVFLIPLIHFFTTDGLPEDGINQDMAVDGSSTDISFFIEANQDTDTYIRTILFEIADAGADLNQFGNVSARTNGVLFEWITTDKGSIILDSGLKTNYDFVRLCGGNPAIGATVSAFRASNVSGTAEGYIPVMNIEELFGMPYGFRLRKGTKDRLQFTVRDDCTAPTSFRIKALGTQL